ncbi:MAG: patatin-like phospholipase family protein [Flavobacteriales bacterium]|nr:hypothetical protein [Flavobacteriales bacterium]
MVAKHKQHHWSRRVLYFFPVQLLLLHIKKNHFLLLIWLILFGYVTENMGVKYGVPNLFLFPEYYGRVSFWSYMITGFALGGFITAFNLYSYAMHGYRFPFIATIAKPFLKFNVNNAVIPILFILTYLSCSAQFQYYKEFVDGTDIIVNLLGFIVGVLGFLFLALIYFTSTNTDIIKLLGKDPEPFRPDEPMMDILGPQQATGPKKRSQRRKASRWLRRAQRTEKWKVETYLSPRGRLLLARSSEHYDKELLRDVLWQNHINGSIFEMVIVLSFIALGAFGDLRFFAIPAGASAFLFFTMILMIISALYSWMQGWTSTVILGVIILLNVISHSTEKFMYDDQAYGLDYSVEPATYDRDVLYAMANDTATSRADADAMLATLELWKKDNLALDGTGKKPTMLIVNTSGGGLRAMLWTLRSMQVADSLLEGTLMERSMLMTGSSGGLIGAAYYRQLYLAGLSDPTQDRNSSVLVGEVASDMLNPVAFNFVTNDMFFRYRKVYDDGHAYTLDRGHAFERRLNDNTRGLLDVRFGDMAGAEREARIPLLVINPTSINDGRRVVISALPMAFLTNIHPDAPLINNGEAEAVEFHRLFADQGASRLKLSSALRMNASFPYITPVVTLPSEPPMRVMDAGVRDNYGYRVTLAFLHTFRKWINENTSGVVILQLRDTQKDLKIHPSSGSLLARLLDPAGSVYSNFVRVQDQDYDLMLQQASGWTEVPLQVIDVQLRHDEEEQISLSWHLTALERSRVLRTIHSAENVEAFNQLKVAFGGAKTFVDGSAQGPVMGPVPPK